MWAKPTGTSLALAFSLCQAAHGAAAVTPLQPTSPWDLDYGDTQCVALRDYGNSAKPVTLAIRPAPNRETYELLVGRKNYGPEFVEEYEGSVDFGAGPVKAWLLHYGSPKGKVTLDQFRISAQEMAKARTASFVTLRSKNRADISFSLANMSALLKGLEDCTTDLKRYWNSDGRKDGTIAVGSRGDVRKVFTDNDYPTEAMKRTQEGTAQYLLLINEQGKVAGCHVLTPSGVPVLDAMGCSVIQERAKFTPALDRNGKSIRSTYVTPPISWRIAR